MILIFNLVTNITELLIEATGDFACQLKVWNLIFPNWNTNRTKREDVRGLTDCVKGKAKGVVLSKAFDGDFIFERRISPSPG